MTEDNHEITKTGDLSKTRIKQMIAIILIIIIVIIIVVTIGACFWFSSQSFQEVHLPTNMAVVAYYNSHCQYCVEYIAGLKFSLASMNITRIQEKDVINDPDARIELTLLYEKWAVPISAQGSPVISIDNRFLFENYVPAGIIADFLKHEANQYEMIIVFQEDYQTYRISTKPGQIEDYQTLNSSRLWDIIQKPDGTASEELILPLVVTSGLIDSINPCAFAILISFISFASAVAKIRSKLLGIGLIYIGSLYVTYLLIGLGFLKTVNLFSVSHLVAKVGILLVVLFGLINIKDYFRHRKHLSLKVPNAHQNAIINLIHKATAASAAVLGIIAGLSEFPCTGSIYIATLGLLTLRTTFWQGLTYLIVYNLMFVLPLLIILFVASNRKLRQEIKRWRELKKRAIKLVTGSLMVGAGIALYWFLYAMQ